MKKLLSLLTIALLIPQIAFGWGLQGFVGSDGNFPHGVTFAAVYDAGLDADISTGSPTATFAASRDATHPATYFDSSGVMQKTTTSNVGRFNHGYYNTTGWHAYTHAGVMEESAGTNYLTHSIFDAGATLGTGWTDDHSTDSIATYSLVDVSDTFNVGTTVQSQRIVYTGVAADVGAYSQILQSTAAASFEGADANVTISCFIKGSSSDVSITLGYDEYNNASAWLSQNMSSVIEDNISATEWRKFTYSHTTDEATCDHIFAILQVAGIDDGDTIDLQLVCFQVEKSTHATSFIPTTVAALTRNAETNKYAILNNRTAAVESAVMKVAPEWIEGAGQGGKGNTSAYLITTDTKNRRWASGWGTDYYIDVNVEDSVACSAQGITTFTTVNEEITIGYNIQHSSPYATLFRNGIADTAGEETSDDFTNPAWGTYFWVGSKNDGTFQLNGTILGIAFFDRVLSAAEMLDLHNKDWRTLR